MIEEKMGEQKDRVEKEPPSPIKDERHVQSPWQTGIYQREHEEH